MSADFTESLAFLLPLQKLRAGDIPAATRLMETTCFGRANVFLKYPTPLAGEAGQWVKIQGLLQPPDAAMARRPHFLQIGAALIFTSRF
jgi:hypothetical protein